MYEIWLALNIVYETVLPWLPVWVVLGLLWLLVTVVALRSAGSRWRATLTPVLLITVLAAVATFLMVPSATQSNIRELNYWVDWAFLGSVALGAGALVAVVGWPLLAWLSSQRT
jgi:hypothetical protein